MQEEILNTPNLSVNASPVEDLILEEIAPEENGNISCSHVCKGVVLGNYYFNNIFNLYCADI